MRRLRRDRSKEAPAHLRRTGWKPAYGAQGKYRQLAYHDLRPPPNRLMLHSARGEGVGDGEQMLLLLLLLLRLL